MTGQSLQLQKYSPSGVLRWTIVGQGDDPYLRGGLAVGPQGHVYVIDPTIFSGENDSQLQKYSSSGILLWTQSIDGSRGVGVAVAPDGDVYVTGTTMVSGEPSLLLQKYSDSGALLWTQTYGTSSEGYGVAIGPGGGVYVTGTIMISGEENLLLQKYSPSGILRWTQTYYQSYGAGVAVAPDGSVYVTGRIKTAEFGDLLLQKYSPSGILRWTQTFDGETHSNDMGAGIAVDSDGVVYVVGTTYSLEIEQDPDVLLQKYSSSGTLLCTQIYNTPGDGGREFGRSVAVDKEGSIYITGSLFSYGLSNDPGLLLLKYR